MQTGETAHWQQLRLYKNPLILALAIHFVFILMLARHTPVWQNTEKPKHEPAETAMLSVSLKHIFPAHPEADLTIPEPENREKTEPLPVIEKPTEAVIPREPLPQKTQVVQESMPQHPARLISSQELHSQLLRQLKPNRDANNHAVLGKFSSHDLPKNWTRKAVDYTPGMFKAAELPTKAIVLDQWRNTDGSVQNKIKLPNGDIVCGSRAAHNPLDIYSMPIWMYRSC
ncbi:MAG: hypothetical protein IMF09_10460 [Proteobacteria bacterium]|nr:hypothetical protein [Pseudomonadota bacterium]